MSSKTLFQYIVEASLIMVKYFARQCFITKLYLDLKLLLNFGTYKFRKRHMKYFRTSDWSKYYRRFSDYRGFILTERFPSIHFQSECKPQLQLKWFHYAPNISGLLLMLLSLPKCVQRFSPLKHDNKYIRYFKCFQK